MKSGQQSAEGAPEGEQAPSGPKPHERVPALLGRARDDAQACRELIDALIAMRAPGDEADEARVVVAQLDAKSLEGLRDEAGRDARAEAVETLLSLGFPYALNVSPEDLAYFRDEKPQTLADLVRKLRRTRTQTLQFALAVQAIAAGTVYAAMKPEPAFSVPSFLLGGATVALAAWLSSRPPKDKPQTVPMTFVSLGLIATAAAGALAGPVGLGLTVVVSLVVYQLLGWQPEK
jgi:hypothetical protein